MNFILNFKRNIFLCLLLNLFLIFQGSIGCAQESTPSSSDTAQQNPTFVFIDKKEPSYTVYTGILQDYSEEELEKIKLVAEDAEEWKGVDLVAWGEFEQNTENYIKARILKNEYSGQKVAKGIIELIKQSPESPVGLTWNGGIAITYNDYQYAKRTYQQYMADPEEYERKKNKDPYADPVNPKCHFGPLLGWE